MDNEQDTSGAAVKFPPPLVFILGILIGYGLNTLWPAKLSDTGVGPAGVVLVVLGLIIVALASVSFKRAHTHIEPWKPTSTIIDSGIFGHSRNPIYLAFCVITAGAGLVLNSLWVTLSVVPSIIAVYHIAISKEEQYLEAKFGDDYRAYKNRVRRWL